MDKKEITSTVSNFLDSFSITWINKNEECKRSIENQTLFFMPHCTLQMYHNLLSVNWNTSALSKTILIGNSFQSYIDKPKCESFVHPLASYTIEKPITQLIDPKQKNLRQCLLYDCGLNDTCVHHFIWQSETEMQEFLQQHIKTAFISDSAHEELISQTEL